MLDVDAHGVFVISVTPFRDDGALDLDGADRLVDFYAAAGCNGITILGIMGEAPKLDADEALNFARRVVERAKGLAVVVGVSASGFAAMARLARAAMDAGAAGVMIAPPGGLKGDDRIVEYFVQCVAVIGDEIPFALQDYPYANGLYIPVSVIRRVAETCPSCVMLKHEDWPGLDKITALRQLERNGEMRHISILSGNGGLFLPLELDRGADGAMTGYAYPEMLVGVCDLIRAGRRAEAHDLFDAHLPLVRYEQQPGVGLAVRKYILRRRGVLTSDAQRNPAARLSEAGIADVEWLLARLAAYPLARLRDIAARAVA
jgi:4-hydroxy-tetrahydrodipicolinate synthase